MWLKHLTQGKTSVKKNCYNPVWNEQIVFTEMFPPLCQVFRIKQKETNLDFQISSSEDQDPAARKRYGICLS